MKKQKEESSLKVTIIFVIIVIILAIFIWFFIQSYLESFEIFDTKSQEQVDEMNYISDNTLEMINGGNNYGDYVLCKGSCSWVNISRNNSREIITDQECNAQCLNQYGIEKIVKKHSLSKRWLDKNCEKKYAELWTCFDRYLVAEDD